MKAALILLLVLAAALPAQLPPEVQLDRYMRQAAAAIEREDYEAASAALDKVGELKIGYGLELPDLYFFRGALVAYQTGRFGRAKHYAERYLTLAGRDGDRYTEALDLLDAAETGAFSDDQVCKGKNNIEPCWRELDNKPSCYVWHRESQESESISWIGVCRDGLAQGYGAVSWGSISEEKTETGRMLGGRFHGVVSGVISGDPLSIYRKNAWKIPYINGNRHGVYEEFYEDGPLFSTVSYVSGDRRGLFKRFHEDGSLAVRVPYSNGKRHGFYESFGEDGSLDSRGSYVNGKRHGLHEQFWPNGSLLKKHYYVNGIQHGVSELFNSKGLPTVKTFYVHGKLHGVNEWYREDGSLKSRTPYVKGKPHGVQEHYNLDGSLESKTLWVNGEKQE